MTNIRLLILLMGVQDAHFSRRQTGQKVFLKVSFAAEKYLTEYIKKAPPDTHTLLHK